MASITNADAASIFPVDDFDCMIFPKIINENIMALRTTEGVAPHINVKNHSRMIEIKQDIMRKMVWC